jgi:thiamine biosynthesis protein ThiS
MLLNVTVSGALQSIEEGQTIGDLLREKGVNPKRVAVELNRRILPRENFDSTAIHEGDVIEVVRFVGGG